MRYLLSATPGTTAVLLSGGSLRFIHDAAKVARAHQPAIVVLEDCDLVAEDRSFGMGASPLLFEVLDALDGLDSDADVAFVLTTNRVADLEVALAQRPAGWTSPPRSRCPTSTVGWSCSASTAATSSAPRRCRRPRPARRAPRPPSPRSSCAAPCSPRPSRMRRPATTTSAAALEELLSDTQRLTRSLLGVGPGRTAAEPEGPAGPASMALRAVGPDGIPMGMHSGRRAMRSRASFAYDPTVPG